MTVTNKPRNVTSVRVIFNDVTAWKLLVSCWHVFRRIYALSGYSQALRVFPIIWTLIHTVRGFSEFHLKEYNRFLEAEQSGLPVNDLAMPEQEEEHYRQLGSWLCQSLHSFGPTFIKIGQTLSTRADLLPLPAMLELARLQEEVEPFATEIALALIESELGGKLDEFYKSFNRNPIAAASLSQAHKAVLKDGRDVIVKVQRPDLAKILSYDIQILAAIAEEVMQYPSLCRHTDWPGVVQEFARTVFEEIDYIREGRNADRFRHNFRNFDLVFIPRIVWRLTGRRVLTIEYVDGAKVTDVEKLDAQGIDREEITKSGCNFYLRQLLDDGFFHADPHPGNMRIMADGRVGIFDFGMVGRISPILKGHLVNAFLHVIERKYRDLVDDFVGMGFLDAEVDRDRLCSELTPIFDKRFADGMNRLKFRQLLFDFSDVCWRYPFRLPTEFTYVMRALLTLEGVALTINPNFNFVEATMPFAHRILLKNNASIGKALFKEVFSEGRFNRSAAIDLFKAAARLSSIV